MQSSQFSQKHQPRDIGRRLAQNLQAAAQFPTQLEVHCHTRQLLKVQERCTVKQKQWQYSKLNKYQQQQPGRWSTKKQADNGNRDRPVIIELQIRFVIKFSHLLDAGNMGQTNPKEMTSRSPKMLWLHLNSAGSVQVQGLSQNKLLWPQICQLGF